VWIASLISSFGGLIQSVAAGWLMTSLTGSAALVALVQASTALPIMLFSLSAGAIADNYDKRRVMLVAQVFMAAVSVLLAVCAYVGLMTPWSLLAFTFLIGCGTALNNPAWQSSVRDMVPREDLSQAVALNSVGMNIARSVGPTIGGMIVAAAGAAAAFAANAFSYLAMIGVLVRWQPERRVQPLPPEPLGAAMGAGVRFVVMSPMIRTVLVRAFMFGLAGSAVQALMPLVARDLVKGGPITFGILLGGFGLGAVAGGLLSGAIRRALGTEGLVRLSFVGFATCALVAAMSASTLVTTLAMALGGACWVLALSSFNVAVQLSSPRWVVGRTLALYQTAAFGGMAVGSWTWGQVAEQSSISQALVFSALVHILAVIVGLRWALPDEPQASDPASQRPHRHHRRVPHPRGRHRRVPRAHGGAQAHPAARRRAPLASAARPCGSRGLDRTLRHADMARLHALCAAHHPCRFRHRRPLEGPALRIRAAAGASPHRTAAGAVLAGGGPPHRSDADRGVTVGAVSHVRERARPVSVQPSRPRSPPPGAHCCG
jgi:MFS family permease